MKRPSENTSNPRIAILAKYEWYLNDGQKILSPHCVEVRLFRNLPDLERAVEIESHFDYIFIPHFSEMIPPSLYENFPCVGFHTGDLPADRGGSPIQNKILTGKYLTSVSAFYINQDIDSGPILLQTKIDLSEGTISQILRNLSEICAQMMLSIIKTPQIAVEQEGHVRVKSRRKAIDSLLPSVETETRHLYDRIRMVDGLDYPRAFITWGDFKLEFSEAKFEEGELRTICTFRRKE